MRTENEIKAALKKLAVYENRAYEKYLEALKTTEDLSFIYEVWIRMCQIRRKINTLNWVLGNSDFLEEGINNI